MRIQPIGNRLLVKLMKEVEQKSPSGIVKPVRDKDKKPPTVGVVLAIGEGKLLPNGIIVSIDTVKVGDTVAWAEYTDTPLLRVEDDLKDVAIVALEDVICVIKETSNG